MSSMHINQKDNKFGLPRPDFQALPKKKILWPFWVVLFIIAMLIAAKLGHTFYSSKADVQNLLPPSGVTENSDMTDGATGSLKTLHPSHTATALNQIDANGSDQSNQLITGDQTFERKKKLKIKESISATQKQLAVKKTKPLIKPATCQQLNEPQGIYHLVVVSHLDKRSAMKEVQKLIKKNLGVCLILPRIDKGEKYYRVTIGHSKTQYEADEKIKQFKPIYRNIFVLKY